MKVRVRYDEIHMWNHVVDVDDASYTEWLDGADPTDENLREYITSFDEWQSDLIESRTMRNSEVYDADIKIYQVVKMS